MTVPGGEGSAGVQAVERTSLAWDRTSLALLACGALVVRGLPPEVGRHGRPGVGAVIVVLAVASWLVSVWSGRRRRRSGGAAAGAAVPIRGMALSTALIGVAAFVLAAVG
ncbi:MAG: DUF202 domain-containing protein [Actinomycetota bacterium]